jgi:hypothetical protein
LRPPTRLAELLAAPVLVGTIRVGEVAGIFVAGDSRRAIGLEVETAGGLRRFLPWVGASIEADAVRTPSSLLLVDDVSAYERCGAVALRDRVALDGLGLADEGPLGGTLPPRLSEGPKG